MKEYLVFVPGLLGSELYDGETKVWPGSGWNAVRGFSEDHFQRLLKPDLEARDIVRNAIGGFVDIYGDWISRFESLRSASDFSRLFDEKSGTLRVVPYDWRKPIQDAAQRLSSVVDEIAAQDTDSPAINLICHSQGGLVARYYLQSGDFSTRPGLRAIKTFITFGTPHNGAPIALAGVLGKHKTNFLSLSQSQRLANDRRYPALYQIFPRSNQPLLWERTANGRLTPHRLDEEAFVIEHVKLDPVNYQAYREFRNVIDTRPYPEQVRRFVLMGTRYETITHFFWTGRDVQPVECDDGGDGTVSIQGAYLPEVQCRFTGESHVSLIKSAEARQTFQDLMDATGLLAAGIGQVEVSTRDILVDNNAPIHLSIISDGTMGAMSGEIVIEGAPLPADLGQEPGKVEFMPLRGRPPQPFDYRGPSITSATMKLAGIGTPGVYRVTIQSPGGALPFARSPNFIVIPTVTNQNP